MLISMKIWRKKGKNIIFE